MKNKKQTIGFWDKGKETELHNISTEGFDIGIKAEGDNLYAENIDLKKDLGKKMRWYEIWWIKFIVFPLFITFIVYLIGWN